MVLTKDLLNLIILIQSYKYLIVSENVVFKTNRDWYSETKMYYYSINKEILNNIGISTNNYDFENILGFKITSEMMSSKYDELSRFEF